MNFCCGVDTVAGVAASAGSLNTVVEQGAIIPEVVAATATGSTDDQVLNFTGATVQVGALSVATWLTRTDSATLGTRLQPIQSGIYSVVLYIPWAAGQNVFWAITYNATTAQRQTTNAEPVAPESYAAAFLSPTVIEGDTITAIIPVSQEDIDAGTNIIRCHSGDPIAPGDTPPAGAYISVAQTGCRIFRIGDMAA